MPVQDGSFHAVLSVFEVMFAPDHQRAADEIIRAARPGGTVGLASWTPDGFISQMFGVITRHVPGPSGGSPLLWGTEQHLSGLFGAAAADARPVQRTSTWFAASFRRWYGPALKAFEVLDDNGRAALAARRTVRPAGSRPDRPGSSALTSTARTPCADHICTADTTRIGRGSFTHLSQSPARLVGSGRTGQGW